MSFKSGLSILSKKLFRERQEEVIFSLIFFSFSFCCSAQDGNFNNLNTNTLTKSGGFEYHSGWGVNTDNIVDQRPNAQDRPVFVMNNHFGLTFSAHSYYGGIRFYNQAYPGNPLSVANGAQMVMSLVNGNVGIGTTSPAKKLEVNTDVNADGIKIGAGVTTSESSANIYLYPSSNYSTSRNWLISTLYDNYGDFVIRSSNAQGGDPYAAGTTRFAINSNGNIGIGTSNPGPYKLAVDGTIGARKVKVTQVSPWADYVFNDGYPLMPLKVLDDYIHKEKHLPDVPSAKEVEQNGLDLGDNQATLLKKIEELTLYIIQQNKKLEEQESKIEVLSHQIKTLNSKLK